MMYFPTASVAENSARVVPFSSLLLVDLIQAPSTPHPRHSRRKCLRPSEKGHETLLKCGFYQSALICSRQTDNRSKLDGGGGVESKSDQKKDWPRRGNTRRVSSDRRPDSHGTGEGDAGAPARVTNMVSQAVT